MRQNKNLNPTQKSGLKIYHIPAGTTSLDKEEVVLRLIAEAAVVDASPQNIVQAESRKVNVWFQLQLC